MNYRYSKCIVMAFGNGGRKGVGLFRVVVHCVPTILLFPMQLASRCMRKDFHAFIRLLPYTGGELSIEPPGRLSLSAFAVALRPKGPTAHPEASDRWSPLFRLPTRSSAHWPHPHAAAMSRPSSLTRGFFIHGSPPGGTLSFATSLMFLDRGLP